MKAGNPFRRAVAILSVIAALASPSAAVPRDIELFIEEAGEMVDKSRLSFYLTQIQALNAFAREANEPEVPRDPGLLATIAIVAANIAIGQLRGFIAGLASPSTTRSFLPEGVPAFATVDFLPSSEQIQSIATSSIDPSSAPETVSDWVNDYGDRLTTEMTRSFNRTRFEEQLRTLYSRGALGDQAAATVILMGVVELFRNAGSKDVTIAQSRRRLVRLGLARRDARRITYSPENVRLGIWTEWIRTHEKLTPTGRLDCPEVGGCIDMMWLIDDERIMSGANRDAAFTVVQGRVAVTKAENAGNKLRRLLARTGTRLLDLPLRKRICVTYANQRLTALLSGRFGEAHCGWVRADGQVLVEPEDETSLGYFREILERKPSKATFRFEFRAIPEGPFKLTGYTRWHSVMGFME